MYIKKNKLLPLYILYIYPDSNLSDKIPQKYKKVPQKNIK